MVFMLFILLLVNITDGACAKLKMTCLKSFGHRSANEGRVLVITTHGFHATCVNKFKAISLRMPSICRKEEGRKELHL